MGGTETQHVFLGHGNPIVGILKKQDVDDPVPVAVNLSSVTAMTLTLGGTMISSDNGDTDPIRWAKSGYATGEYRLYLGDQAITAGSYRAYLVVYDPGYPTGLVWLEPIPVMVHAEVEAS